MRILLFLIILLIIETIATALIKKIRLKHRAQLLILAKENALLSSEFVLPDWAKDEEGNRLFAKACAIGAIPGSLLFKSAALEYIETKVANQGSGEGPIKLFAFMNLKGRKVYFRGPAIDFNRYLDRNQVNLIDRENSEVDGDFVLFDDIVSIVEKKQDVHTSLPRYYLIASEAQIAFNNANTKVQAWTDGLEAEAGNAMAKIATPISAGLYHDTHSYQVFAKHRHEKALRERDGFFLSLADNAILLVSVKARYGLAEQNELLVDLRLVDKFILSDWTFQTEDKKEKTLLQMPEHYPQLKGVKELNFFGIAVSPLFEPDLPEHPQIIRFGRDVHHELQSPDAVGSLVAARIRSLFAKKFSL